MRTTQGTTYIETATAPETFANANDVVFVVGVHGAMGPEFVPFSEKSDAVSFTETYEGRTVTMSDITPAMVNR